MKAVDPLSQSYINRKFQKSITVCIYHCQRASFMSSLFIPYKKDKWCNLVVCISSPVVISFYCACSFSLFLSFFFFLFFFFFGVYYLLNIAEIFEILIIKQCNCSKISKWSFKECVTSSLFSN